VIGIVLSLQIRGGTDDTLVLFKREPNRYRRALVVTAHTYASIQNAYSGLGFVVASVDNEIHVMTAHHHPWISSLWRGVTLRIFAIAADPNQPTQLLRENNNARLSGDAEETASLRWLDDRFIAVFDSWNMLAVSPHDVVRPHCHAFARHDGAYRRVAPYVIRAQDLPDEWLHLPWSEASLLTDEARRVMLQPLHERWQQQVTQMGATPRQLLLRREKNKTWVLARPRNEKQTLAFKFLVEAHSTEQGARDFVMVDAEEQSR